MSAMAGAMQFSRGRHPFHACSVFTVNKELLSPKRLSYDSRGRSSRPRKVVIRRHCFARSVAARPSMSSASGRARPPSIVSSYQASRYHACGLRANGILSIEVTHSERSRFRHRVIPHNAVGVCMQPSKRTGCRSGMQRRQVATHGQCTPTARLEGDRGALFWFLRAGDATRRAP